MMFTMPVEWLRFSIFCVGRWAAAGELPEAGARESKRLEQHLHDAIQSRPRIPDKLSASLE